MKAKGVCGVAALSYAITALTVGGACSAGEPAIQVQQTVQQAEMPSFTKVMGIGEGVLTVQYQREGDAVSLLIADATEPLDAFTLNVAGEGGLAPATKRNRITVWTLGDNLQEVEQFVKRGFYGDPTQLTEENAADLTGYYYSNVIVIEYGGALTIAVWSNDGQHVYTNEESPAVFGFAAADFSGIPIRKTATERKMECCVDCGGSSSCCCDGGDSCTSTDREVKCKKGVKTIERCWCSGSDCACQALQVWWDGETIQDESSDGPGMGNQEG